MNVKRIELSVEYPEDLLGTCDIVSVVLFDMNDKEQDVTNVWVQGHHYSTEQKIVNILAEHYGVDTSVIEIV